MMSKALTTGAFLVKTTVELSEDRILGLLVGAFEGGSNYWVEELTIVRRGERSASSGKAYYTKAQLASLFGEVKFKPAEDDKLYTLNREALQKGLELMASKYPRHFNDIINENDDAETSDVLLQLSLFGDIVYG